MIEGLRKALEPLGCRVIVPQVLPRQDGAASPEGLDVQPFFFSSRRRHTILQGDWSSDVLFRSKPNNKPKKGTTMNPLTQLNKIRILPLLVLALVIGRASAAHATDLSAAPVIYWSNEARRAIDRKSVV